MGPGAVKRHPSSGRKRPMRYGSDESSSDGESGSEDEKESEEEDDEAWARNVRAGKSKGDKLGTVDHSTITYPPFRKSFYIEVPELGRMAKEEVDAYRKELENIKVRGKEVPKPIKSWYQAGLSTKVLDQLTKLGYEKPMPIQAQALPAIMSGRDVIAIAKTGSGKTLGFVLPMLRHVMDQPPLEGGDGPISLIMAPTRELVSQIGREVRMFCKPLGLVSVCVYGGSGVANQITELKRGAEVVTCTPGRMIDVLATSNGRITNLRRVTYLVLDEADRMFDMGFEPQISRIVGNIRPDRQTVMFSATFPRQVEVLARKVLGEGAVEIQVGGRSVVNKDITQYIEIRPDEDRFLRLLEILGEWYEVGKTLIFVNSQEKADNLFRDLLRSGYPCLTLHGGKDQLDRESTLQDFKADVCSLLVATSVAARGLDVKELRLVVNYDPPNHHEDYVHRVGRTGRAGNKGTAITFIGPEEDRYAPDLVKALKESGVEVPQDLQLMADHFAIKRKAGIVHAHGSGFGGSGFKFDATEEAAKKKDRKAAAKQYGLQGSDDDSESDEDDTIKMVADDEGEGAQGAAGEAAAAAAAASAAAAAAGPKELPPEAHTLDKSHMSKVAAAQAVAARLAMIPPPPRPTAPGTGAAAPAVPVVVNPIAAALAALPNSSIAAAAVAARAQAELKMQAEAAANPLIAAALAAARKIDIQAGHLVEPVLPPAPAEAEADAEAGVRKVHFESELEINDFPQKARWKVTHRQTLADICELTGAAIIVKGIFIPPGKPIPEGERKLTLRIEGPTELVVKRAKAEIKRLVEEITEKALRHDAPAMGRYTVT